MAEIDLTPITRLEYDIDAILNDHAVAEPITRIELILADIVAGNTTTVEPVTRIETYLAIISGADYPVPEPVTRIETFLAIIAGEDYEEPEAVTRLEGLLAEWVEKGSGVWKTVTGALIHITDALASPVQALSVAIEPFQSGSGDPSPTNIRPITGATGCNINVTGKNLANVNSQTAQIGYYISAQGVVTADQFNWIYGTYIPVKANTAYTLSFDTSVYYVSISEYSSAEDSGFIKRNAGNTGSNTKLTITTGATTKFIRFGTNLDRQTITLDRILAIHWMLEEGSTASAYKPFGTTYPISWAEAGTVYGGTLDVVNGTLTVNTKTVDLPNINWTYQNGGYFRSSVQTNNDDAKTGPAYCSMYKYNIGTSSEDKVIYWTSAGRLVIRDSSYGSNVSNFLAGIQGIQFVCVADEPKTTYQLTPQQISTLAGENNIWTDVNGEITLEYLAQG